MSTQMHQLETRRTELQARSALLHAQDREAADALARQVIAGVDVARLTRQRARLRAELDGIHLALALLDASLGAAAEMRLAGSIPEIRMRS